MILFAMVVFLRTFGIGLSPGSLIEVTDASVTQLVNQMVNV